MSSNSVEEKTSLKSLATGGTILAVSMLAANGGNYLLNLLLGRWLTPAEFADANLMVTLMLLITAVAVSLQLVSARFISIYDAKSQQEHANALLSSLTKWALWAGCGFGALLVVLSQFWANFFNSESFWPFIILGLGMPFYLMQSVGRGMLQGRLEFSKLSISFVGEMIVRLGVGLLLVALGYGVVGATIGLSISFVATHILVIYLTGNAAKIDSKLKITQIELGNLKTYIGPVAILLLGQIIINNGDVLIVKRYFEPEQAGIYSAIALIGRAVFFISWSAVTTLFPAAAQRKEAGESSTVILRAGLGVVFAMCATMTLGVVFLGDVFLTSVFGESYAGVSHLLTKYAIATSLFALANMIVSHQLSLGRYIESYALLIGSVFQTVLLLVGHSTMDQVINNQIIAMGLLLAVIVVLSRSEILGSKERADNSSTAEEILSNKEPNMPVSAGR